MDKPTFENICIQSRLRPVRRQNCGGRVILIADGWFPTNIDYAKPHYKTVWAVGRSDEQLEVARPLYFEGPVGSTEIHDRIKLALEDAMEIAEGLNNGGSAKDQ